MTEFHLVQYPMERETGSDGQETHATQLICSTACFIIEVTTCRTLNCVIKHSVAEAVTEYLRGHRLKNCIGLNRSTLQILILCCILALEGFVLCLMMLFLLQSYLFMNRKCLLSFFMLLIDTWGVQVVRYPNFFLGNGSRQNREVVGGDVAVLQVGRGQVATLYYPLNTCDEVELQQCF